MLYSKDLHLSVVSLPTAKDYGATVSYDSELDKFSVTSAFTGGNIEFSCSITAQGPYTKTTVTIQPPQIKDTVDIGGAKTNVSIKDSPKVSSDDGNQD